MCTQLHGTQQAPGECQHPDLQLHRERVVNTGAHAPTSLRRPWLPALKPWEAQGLPRGGSPPSLGPQCRVWTGQVKHA